MLQICFQPQIMVWYGLSGNHIKSQALPRVACDAFYVSLQSLSVWYTQTIPLYILSLITQYLWYKYLDHWNILKLIILKTHLFLHYKSGHILECTTAMVTLHDPYYIYICIYIYALPCNRGSCIIDNCWGHFGDI